MSQTLSNSHAVKPGKSINEKLRDLADQRFTEWMEYEGDSPDILQGRVEGICDAMALMTSTKADLQWDSTEARYDDRQRHKRIGSVQT